MVGGGSDKVRSAHFSIAIGRALGTVVVTVHGELDGPGARHLGSVLADIIDGQGNLAVVVDLHDTIASDTSGLSVLAAASERASRHGGVLSLSDPPDALYQALVPMGLDRFVRPPRLDGMCASPSAPFGGIVAPRGRAVPAGAPQAPYRLQGA